MRVHVLQHGKSELVGMGTIKEWANDKNYEVKTTRVDLKEAYPHANEFDFLIVLGGVQGAYQENEYPWLKKEKMWIRSMIEQQKFVLGICLGAQLIADGMGGKANKHSYKEVGWWPIAFNEKGIKHPLLKNVANHQEFYQFHQDTFTLPNDAEHLAQNNACENQAFAIGEHVLALQFHPEIIKENAICMVEDLGETFLEDSPFIQNSEQIFRDDKFNDTSYSMYHILNNFEMRMAL